MLDTTKKFILDTFRFLLNEGNEGEVRALTLRYLSENNFTEEDVLIVESLIEEYKNNSNIEE